MIIKVTQFFALLTTALAFVPSAVHVAAMWNKIRMSQTDYFIAQGIYSGWSVLGVLWLLALLANTALASVSRSQAQPVGAAVSVGLMFVIFFIWTLPANQATANWTSIPSDWQVLRQQWEYSHAVNALICLAAFCLTCLSVLVLAYDMVRKPRCSRVASSASRQYRTLRIGGLQCSVRDR
jgi:cobalamin synthase